jgi:hypothetical protein
MGERMAMITEEIVAMLLQSVWADTGSAVSLATK